jgi:hypothetical protein
MRGRWLVVIAVASLALNVAVVGTFLYQRYSGHGRHHPPRIPGLNPQVVAQVRQIREENAPALESLMEQTMPIRTALAELAGSAQSDAGKADSLCTELGRIHVQIEKNMFAMTRRVLEVLPAEMKEHYLEMLKTNPGRHARQRPGRMRGARRGPGMTGEPPFGGPPPMPGEEPPEPPPDAGH